MQVFFHISGLLSSQQQELFKTFENRTLECR